MHFYVTSFANPLSAFPGAGVDEYLTNLCRQPGAWGDNLGMSSSSALGALPHWDLSTVFPGLETPEFAHAVAACAKNIRALERFLDAHTKKKAAAKIARGVIDGYVTRINAVNIQYGTLASYIASFTTTDSLNMTARQARRESGCRWCSTSRQAARARSPAGARSC
jgi:hypothetical protein